MSKSYKFYFHDGNSYKEVNKICEQEATIGELRALFYDWLACIGYPVQRESVGYLDESGKVPQNYGDLDE